MELEIVEIDGNFAGYNLVAESCFEREALAQICDNYGADLKKALQFAGKVCTEKNNSIKNINFLYSEYIHKDETDFDDYKVKSIDDKEMNAEILYEEIKKAVRSFRGQSTYFWTDYEKQFAQRTEAKIEFIMTITEGDLCFYRADKKADLRNLLDEIELLVENSIPHSIWKFDLHRLWCSGNEEAIEWAFQKLKA